MDAKRTVRVRVAVAVDTQGEWNAAGWSSGTEDERMEIACDNVQPGEARYWLEANLPLPEARNRGADMSTNQLAPVDASAVVSAVAPSPSDRSIA
jgi:hypothetical protein